LTELEIKKKLNKSVKGEIANLRARDGWLNHYHMCDFDILGYKSKTKIKMCKDYLKSLGRKRDKCLECCDHCKHMKYLIAMPDDHTDVVAIQSPVSDKYIEIWGE
jgi:hypothetical protein